MHPLLWLVIPAVATALAILWGAWSGRTRGPVAPQESMAEYERFRAALAPGDRATRLDGPGSGTRH